MTDLARTLLADAGGCCFGTILADPPWRFQVNFLASRKRGHSRKPDEQYAVIERCSPGPYLELFARGLRKGWSAWGNQADETYFPRWGTCGYHSQLHRLEAVSE